MNLTSILPIETDQENSCGTQFITDRLGLCNLTGNRQLDCPEPWAERLLSPAVSQGYGITVDRSTSGRIGQSLVSRRGGMPRSKRRAPSSTNYHNQGGDMPPAVPEDNAPRHSSKRLRHTSSSNRRHQKSEDVSHASAFSQKRCIAWFREYTSPDEPDTLGPEGMEKFCEDIGVEPENVVMLVLAYTMNAKQMGFFTQQEWLKGLTELQCDTIGKLQLRLEYLRNLLNEPLTFKGIYRYAYDFARDKDQRSMDMGTAREMLQLLLGRHWPLYSQFSQFLEQSKYKVINKDQWCNILEFSRTISHDLSNYDLDGAWPVMLDEFVEWLKVQRGEGSTSGDAHGS